MKTKELLNRHTVIADPTEVILMSESIALLVFTLAFISFWLVAMTSALSGLRED